MWTLNQKFYNLIVRFLKLQRIFFASPEVEKIQCGDPDANNVGYVHIPSVREYIKLRPTDDEHYWPKSADFKDAFHKMFKAYSIVAFKAFKILSEAERPISTFYENLHADLDQLISKESYSAICEWIERKSSISAIHYYPTDLSETCEEHTDTGILTFITRTEVPGLEIYDRSVNQYVKVEQLMEDNDLVVFMGEKVPLFSCSESYPATYHRVRIPPCLQKHRYSFAFLLDVAK